MSRIADAWKVLAFWPHPRRHEMIDVPGLLDYNRPEGCTARVDVELADLVATLNRLGLTTTQSCQGRPKAYAAAPRWMRVRGAAYVQFQEPSDATRFALLSAELDAMAGAAVQVVFEVRSPGAAMRAVAYFDPAKIQTLTEAWGTLHAARLTLPNAA